MNFTDFNFDERLLEGLSCMGFKAATPIQEQAIPLINAQQDMIACAQTGTGKTAAFVLPILNKILQTEERNLNTLVLVPTRELAVQIDNQIEGFAYFLSVSSLAIYGGGDGQAWDVQKKALKQGADIIIATPGRLIALLTSGDINLSTLKHLVLDEADRMLDMGFYDDIVRIVSYLPPNRQTLLFSATMPPKIRSLAERILKDPQQISLAISKPAEGIDQRAYMTYDQQKMPLIKSILSEGNFPSVIVFASTKETVKKLKHEFRQVGLNAKSFHSDLEQAERESIMLEFKSKQLPILIGTDILSRGIDVEGISLVVNYDVPPDPEDYIHRIGRTARAATTGVAITFINDKDQRRFAKIEKLIEKEIPKLSLPEELGPAPIYNPKSAGSGAFFKKKRKFKKSGNDNKQ